MKTQNRTLVLRKQTITELSESQLLDVHGGTTAGCALVAVGLGVVIYAATQAIINNALK